MTGKEIAVVCTIAAAGLGLAIALVFAGGKTNPSNDISADRSNVFGHPALQSAPPPPTGRPAAAADEFRRDPCAVVTVDELGVALAEPFHVASGTFPRRDRAPAAKSTGCAYSFVADGSDPAEPFHKLEVTVAQATADGAKELSQCLAGAPKIPYGPVEAGDQACLGAGSHLTIRLGANHYTVNVAATPPRANRSDEDTILAPLVKVAGRLFASRLPGK
jgi:hypothetical protein